MRCHRHPEVPDRKVAGTFCGESFDKVGALLLFVGLTCLMLGLSFGYEIGWQTMVVQGLFVAAAVLLIVFIVYKKRVNEPIVDMILFRIGLFSAALTSSFLSFLALFAVLFLMPLYLEELLGMSAERAGTLMTAVPFTISLIAPFSGWLVDRFGSPGPQFPGIGHPLHRPLLSQQPDPAVYLPRHHLAHGGGRLRARCVSIAQQ
jgi:uncharacterized membrane protein